MMSFLKGKDQPKICPKTGKIINSGRKYRWPWWLFPFTGLAALIWFLVRVIPKPSRAAYPCQRLAFPLASGFIVWLTGLAVSTIAFHKAKRHLLRARYVLAAICIVVSVASIYVALSYTSQDDTLAATPPLRIPQPANAPIGIGKGVHPARVAWIYDPNSTNWGGTSDGYWWEPNHTSQAVVDKMVSKTLRAITGENTDYAAWDAIFRYFNQQQGKGDVGYTPGEKIMIKVNFVGFFYSSTGGSYTFHSNYPNNSPQVIHAILDQLVNVVGVKDADITVGDTLGTFVNDFYNMLHPDFPDVNCLDYYGTSGRGKTGLSSTRVYWSTSSANGKTNDYVPNAFKNASYLINLATLKGHYNQAGITLCGKNHYGSLVRVPSAGGYYNLHDDQIYADGKSGMGHYRNLVDLMGHPHIGGKTLLFLVDGLYAGKHMALTYPIKWLTAPFNNDWPSSLFASQDPVAIDSVGQDFLLKEYPTENNGPAGDGADDYLHEAALAPDPCSGTSYDPDGDGNELTSQGVHEHWNDANNRQYTRNLGTGNGIELVTTAPGQPDLNGDWEVDFKDLAILAKAWRSTAGGPNWDPNCDISTPADNVIDEKDLAVLCDNWLGTLAAGLIAPGAKLQQVYYDANYNFEGPTWDPNSNKLFFTKRPRSSGTYQILRLDSPNNVTVWMTPSPQTNGTILSLTGRLLTADESTMQIRSHRIGASGPEDTTVLCTAPDKPNDLCELTNGDIYFTCPDWTSPTNQGVYLLEPNGVVTRVNNGLNQPNGIITSLDETKLYVAESSSSDTTKKRWWVFPINTDGTLGTGSVFFKPTSPPRTNDPDGMTIDERGNLYFCGLGGVWIVSPSGQRLKLITVTEDCANVCFGGPDYKTLYITCNYKVYSLAMLVRGGE
jgi:sugar lactone lactonase YvrE